MHKHVHLEVTSDSARCEQDTLVLVHSVKVPDILQKGDEISGSLRRSCSSRETSNGELHEPSAIVFKCDKLFGVVLSAVN